MRFPVMQFVTKYGVDYRVGATEANIRSGSRLIGYMEESSKQKAITLLKKKLEAAAEKVCWHLIDPQVDR